MVVGVEVLVADGRGAVIVAVAVVVEVAAAAVEVAEAATVVRLGVTLTNVVMDLGVNDEVAVKTGGFVANDAAVNFIATWDASTSAVGVEADKFGRLQLVRTNARKIKVIFRIDIPPI